MQTTGPASDGVEDDSIRPSLSHYLAALAAGFFVGSAASLLWSHANFADLGF